MEAHEDMLFTVTDLKQYTYCPRVLYYQACLPDVRPTTYKMQAGIEAGEAEQKRAARRNLSAYHVLEGARHFDVPVQSHTLNLSGVVDEVVQARSPVGELVPIDYKLARKAGYHFKVQLTAYAEMLAETWGEPVRRGYLLLIPQRRFEEVAITDRLRAALKQALEAMWRITQLETMPPPVEHRRKCAACEFRRFCNDV
ncbi:MAG: CRISPR-associated protein Cas4 [Anaerolineae bacterium]